MRRLVLALAMLAASAPAYADDDRELSGLAVGIAIGEPSAVTLRYVLAPGRLHADAAVGTGTVAGLGLELHGGVAFVPVVLRRSATSALPVYLGLGGRYYRHGYDAASMDELPDVHAGVRLALGLGLELTATRLEIYGEVAPGYDLYRSDSCSFASGVDTVCPHAQSSRAFVHALIGVRWYLP